MGAQPSLWQLTSRGSRSPFSQPSSLSSAPYMQFPPPGLSLREYDLATGRHRVLIAAFPPLKRRGQEFDHGVARGSLEDRVPGEVAECLAIADDRGVP